jgi:hypothetical protein
MVRMNLANNGISLADFDPLPRRNFGFVIHAPSFQHPVTVKYPNIHSGPLNLGV